MALVVIITTLPANAFVVFLFDKWTPRVLSALGSSVWITGAMSAMMFVSSSFIGAGASVDVTFVGTNIIFLALGLNCASIARSTKENILLFWNIDKPIKEKPAAYVSLLLTAAMIGLCLVEWRAVYLVSLLLVLALPITVSKVQRSMKAGLFKDPDLAARYAGAYLSPVFSRSAIIYIGERLILAVLLILSVVAVFSSPIIPASLEVLLPGGSTLPLASTLLVYIFIFFALGSPLLILLWVLMRRYHSSMAAREKIAAICLFFAILGILVSVALGGVAGVLPTPVYQVWSLVSNAFFSMEMLYIFLIIFDFIPSKRVPFVGQFLPVMIVTSSFLWIYSMSDLPAPFGTFFVPGTVAVCLLLAYYLILPHVRSRRPDSRWHGQ
ncbi:MAG: hypothetical protein JW839_14695 [Candidatus Lokiarchaeota archaeon]|nr:hypothetical protein [Candidatus Lokiarchaeota archaeon]